MLHTFWIRSFFSAENTIHSRYTYTKDWGAVLIPKSLSVLGVSNVISNIIAWVLSVLFAFITNKLWVFESKTFGPKAICKEIVLFVGARLFSLVLELIIMFIGMDLLSAGERTVVVFEKTLPLGEFITKTIAQIVIIVSNYVFSKLVVFRKKRENSE